MKFLTTTVLNNDLSLQVFVEETEPVSIPQEDDPPIIMYSVLLKDEQNNTYGKMSYSLDDNSLEILELEKEIKTARYVGKALVEWAFRKSHALGKQGNIGLTSAYGSYVFWYPMGFRSKHQQENKAIAALITTRKQLIKEGERLPQEEEEDELSFTFMYLPEEVKAKFAQQFIPTAPALNVSGTSHSFFEKADTALVVKSQLTAPAGKSKSW